LAFDSTHKQHTADVEALVLSGELFKGNGDSTRARDSSTSPSRSSTPDSGWHDEYVIPDVEDVDSDGSSSSAPRGRNNNKRQAASSNHPSIGMRPGRTGVKGVIRDRAEATEITRAQLAREMEEVRSKMEKLGGGAMTVLEEEREREREREREEGEEGDGRISGEGRDTTRRDVFGREREGKFGHLREVGMSGFVAAVEEEEREVWVVVHLYEPVSRFI
jgi:hypothetical protein